MGIIEALALVASIFGITAGLMMTAFLIKDELKKLHHELKYMNGKTNRLIQLSRLSLEPVDVVQGEPIVVSELTDEDWSQIWALLCDVEGGASA